MDLISMEKVRHSSRKEEIRRIYEQAFPTEPRLPFPMMVAMSYLWNTEFFAYHDGGAPCGLTYLATVGRQTFVMFFAVDEKLRSQGYGSRILDRVQRTYPNNTILISIETCHDKTAGDLEVRQRRKRFYLRNGYQETGYLIRLGTTQEIIVKNGVFRKWKFQLFFALYSFFTMYPKIWKLEASESPAPPGDAS